MTGVSATPLKPITTVISKNWDGSKLSRSLAEHQRYRFHSLVISGPDGGTVSGAVTVRGIVPDGGQVAVGSVALQADNEHGPYFFRAFLSSVEIEATGFGDNCSVTITSSPTPTTYTQATTLAFSGWDGASGRRAATINHDGLSRHQIAATTKGTGSGTFDVYGQPPDQSFFIYLGQVVITSGVGGFLSAAGRYKAFALEVNVAMTDGSVDCAITSYLDPEGFNSDEVLDGDYTFTGDVTIDGTLTLNGPVVGLDLSLAALTDTDVTSVADGDLLFYLSGEWIDTAGGLTWDGSTLGLNGNDIDGVGQIEFGTSQGLTYISGTNSGVSATSINFHVDGVVTVAKFDANVDRFSMESNWEIEASNNVIWATPGNDFALRTVSDVTYDRLHVSMLPTVPTATYNSNVNSFEARTTGTNDLAWTLQLGRSVDSGSGAVGIASGLRFAMENASSVLHEYAGISARATDVTNGSEDGVLDFWVVVGGTLTKVAEIDSTGFVGAVSALNDLSDVDLTGAADGDILYRSGGNWIDSGGNLTWDASTLSVNADLHVNGGTATIGGSSNPANSSSSLLLQGTLSPGVEWYDSNGSTDTRRWRAYIGSTALTSLFISPILDNGNDSLTQPFEFDQIGNFTAAAALEAQQLLIDGTATSSIDAGSQDVALNLISTDATALVSFQDSSTTAQGYVAMGAVGNELIFRSNNAEAMRIQSNQRVKIGNESGAAQGQVHIETGSAGTISPSGSADELVVEAGGAGGISIFTPDASNGSLYFGSASSDIAAFLQYNYNADDFRIGTNVANHSISIRTAANTLAATFEDDQRLNMEGHGIYNMDAVEQMNAVSRASSTAYNTNSTWTSAGLSLPIRGDNRRVTVRVCLRLTTDRGIEVRFINGLTGSAARVWSASAQGYNMTPQTEVDGYRTTGFNWGGTTGVYTNAWVQFTLVIYQASTDGTVSMEYRSGGTSGAGSGARLDTGSGMWMHMDGDTAVS